MIKLSGKVKFGIGLFIFCCGYWLLDSLWAYVSFEKNLSYLVFREPMSYLDTLRLEVSPYQFVSRIMVIIIFMVTGTMIALFFQKRKKAEQDKILLERQLQQAHKLESLGTLAGGIAHDFNNILYGILGYTELCMDVAEQGTELRENLEEIRSGCIRAKDLIGQILTFSKTTREDHKTCQMTSIVSEVARLLKATVPSNISVHVDANPAASFVDCSSTQIHQVIMNLCTNAVHAMESKGGVLTISMNDEHLESPMGDKHLIQCAPGDYLKISVTDTGDGIPEDFRSRIFDPFFTSKEQGKGSGMGLAVVLGIVRSHGGCITFRCPEDGGTVFEVYLPIAAGDAPKV
jgi:signal transduction histidine kinase